MFGLLKFLFYSCVAVVVGVVIGTVPFGGRTVAERIAAVYQPAASQAPEPSRRPAAPKAVARAAARAKSVGSPVPAPVPAAGSVPQGPITAGAANSPDSHSESDKLALDQLVATRVKAK